MPAKKGGVHEKKEAAKEREEGKKQAAKDRAAQEAEARAAAAEREERGRAGARKEEEERKRAEQAAKKAELKRLQEEEEAALSARKAKNAPGGVQKMTKYQLDKQKELEEEMRLEEQRERQLASRREMDASSYTKLVDHENVNRAGDGEVHARSVEGALAALTLKAEAEEEKHPEKRMKAAWKAYEERTMIELKRDKPGLKMSQYRDMIWKLWQKSPDNPMNMAAAAQAVARRESEGGPSR